MGKKPLSLLVTRYSSLVMVQVHIFAHGRVQGVSFRYYVHKRSIDLGLRGYVRNLHDGRVEILAQGSQEGVQKIVDYVRGSPGLSYVVKLDINWEEPLNGLSSFRIEF
jgi:acylphosphatase